MITTVGQLLVNKALPEDLQDHGRHLNDREISKLLLDVAERHPEKYKEVAYKLMNIGHTIATQSGTSLSLADFTPGEMKKRIEKSVRTGISEILHDPRIPREAKGKALVRFMQAHQAETQPKILEHDLAKGNRLADVVKSGTKGSLTQFGTSIGMPLLFTDHNQQPIPIPIIHNSAEGLDPAEFYASTFGTRYGLLSTKLATAEAGDFGKQLAKAAHRMVVTEHDCGVHNGIVVDGDDPQNIGTVLVNPVGGLKAGSIIHRADLPKLKGQTVMVRSPITCQAEGVCSKCAGVRERGTFPAVGDNLGVPAAQALSERMSQGSLNCLVEGTLVLMADFTSKPIEDVRVGDQIIGSDIAGRTFVTTVTNVWDQGYQPAYRYSFRRGSTREILDLESTEIHPVLMNEKVSGQLDERFSHTLRVLPVGKKRKDIAAVLPTEFVDNRSSTKHEKYALLLGLLVGDGCLTLNEVVLSCADQTLIDDIEAYLESLGLRAVKRQSSYNWAIVQREQVWSGHLAETGFRHPVKVCLDKYGYTGKYAHEKTVPADIFSWDKESIFAFLSGLFAADGSAYKGKDGHIGLTLSSTSRPLLEQVRKLLEYVCCIRPSVITRIGKAGTKNYVHDCWQISIGRFSDLRAFANSCNMPGLKGRRLEQYLKSAAYTSDELFYRCRRVRVESIGIRHCWDLEVAHSDSLFVLRNGLIVHNTKHTSGVAGSKSYGFEDVERLFQVPKNYPGAARLAETTGKVTAINTAPTGGVNVMINDKEHWVPDAASLKVKRGDDVEAGDALDEGVLNPKEVAHYRGIGEARRRFVDDVMTVSNHNINRRNAEIISRALVSHVSITDPEAHEGAIPGDVVNYDKMAKYYQPRQGYTTLTPNMAKGMFLERPTMHYSIGTKVDNRVAQTLKSQGVKAILVHKDPPTFEPRVDRMMTHLAKDPDWMTRLHGYYLKDNLLDAVHKGLTSQERSTSFVPSLSKGVDFGKTLTTEGKY